MTVVPEASEPAPTPPAPKKKINLALQGGGAHGAFTWGVLDRLLEEERIGFDGISATSAGAMNAAVFASGMSAGGREGAKKALAEFWRRISQATLTSPLQTTLLDRLFGQHSIGQSARVRLFRTDDSVVLAVRVQPSGPESST